MFEYQENHRYFAQAGRGLEELAESELKELGAVDCMQGYCGVYFNASQETLYRINYCSRIISRVLAPLVSFHCPSDQVLYKKAQAIDWSTIFPVEKTFAIFSSVSDSLVKHSQFAALRLKDAIADYFRKKHGRRPDVNPEDPDIWFNLNIRNDRAVISLDTSGSSLHRRGYRKATVEAPIQETLAAAIIRISGWPGPDDEIKPLLDPMCGSGTFLSEALMVYCRIPPGFKRHTFGFFHLPDFDFKLWKEVKNTCDRNIREFPPGARLIKGSDISLQAVEAALRNLKEIPGGFRVPVQRKDFRDIRKAENHIIITNPPYGVRMSDMGNLQALFKDLGDFLKQRCQGSTAYILAGNKELSKHIGLKISRRIPLYNGPLEIRLLKIEAY
ncbi:MAG TPA: THUMP domain-containing protein [Candidatus Deferrimicrobium sp.]|nr:THUMP domain-containing protein [Candidatus Deferrimicrobium sp.]